MTRPREALRALHPLSPCCAMREGQRSQCGGAVLARLSLAWAARRSKSVCGNSTMDHRHA